LQVRHPENQLATAGTSAVESRAAAESTTTAVEACTAVEGNCRMAAGEAAGNSCGSAMVTIAWAIAEEACMAVVTVARAAIEAARTIPAVIPRASADEDAAHKVISPIVTVRGASIRVVAVITIGTNRCCPNSGRYRTYANAHGNLSLSACGHEKQNSKQSNIF
jgi:hypothetical protein